MAETSIEWTDHSINPIRARVGEHTGHYCEKLSSGCANCYASRLQARFRMPEFPGYGKAKTVTRIDEDTVRIAREGEEPVDVFFDRLRLLQVVRRKKPTRFFWCDMTDLFAEWVPDEWIDQCFGAMAITPWHTHQVLTKRPERMATYLSSPDHAENTYLAATSFPGSEDVADNDDYCIDLKKPLYNVHLGTSCENQKEADERIPHLERCPAAVRFLSLEPSLGAIGNLFFKTCDICGGSGYFGSREIFGAFGPENQRAANPCFGCANGFEIWGMRHSTGRQRIRYGISWVIVGGESGHGARPMVLGWAKDIVRQGQSSGVPVFVKQLGAKPTNREGQRCPHIKHPKGADMSEWPEELRVREFPKVRP